MAGLLALLWITWLMPRPVYCEPGTKPSLAPAGEGPAPGRSLVLPGVLELRAPLSRTVHVPASKFSMGSTPDDVVQAFTECTTEPLGQLCRVELFSDEVPLREVRLSGYWLDRHEVTVDEYARCVALGRCAAIPYFKGATRFARGNYPVTLVTWEDAKDYCAFVGARLPTEAEFERAARGASRRLYPWGNLYNSRVSNHGRLASDPTDAVDGHAELAAVGSYPAGATPERIFDLAGNVEEWVHDRYALEYDPKDLVDPRGPVATATGSQRVVRGGNFESPRAWLRGASRDPAAPSERHAGRGFRCARSAPGVLAH